MKKSFLKLFLLSSLATCLGGVCFINVHNSRSLASAAYNTSASTFYSNITAKSGVELLGQVHDLMASNHLTYTSYETCKDPAVVYSTDPGSNSSYITDFYTQTDLSSSWGSGNPGTWNREHVWPQAQSNNMWGTSGAGGDIHHIRPVETRLNGTRGNKKFAPVRSIYSSYENAYQEDSKDNYTNIIGGYYSGDYFEPIDEVKGDVARICMYIYAHYNTYSNVGGTTNGEGSSSYFGNLPITNIARGTKTDESSAWETLLKWNKDDPVSSSERIRNEAAAKLTGTRNAFIDHPEYADAIWGDETIEGGNETDSNIEVRVTGVLISNTSATVDMGESIQLSATIIPTSSTNKNVTWTSSNSSVASVSSNGIVTGLSEGTTTISVKTSDGGFTDSCLVTVNYSEVTNNSGGDILPTDLPNSYPTSDTQIICASGINLKIKYVANYGSKIQFKASSGYLYSSESMVLKSITLKDASGKGSVTVYGGSSTNPTKVISSSNNSYDLSGCKYFKIANVSANAVTFSAIEIKVASDSPEDEAQEFAKAFNSANVCGTNNYTSAFSSIWLSQKEEFNKLSYEAKLLLINGDADEFSSNEIDICLARYDRILYLHGNEISLFPDFIGRIEAGTYSYSSISDFNTINNQENFTLVFTLSSIFCMCAAVVFYKLKKE